MQLSVYVLKVTDEAALLDYEGDEQWLPKSLVSRDDLDIFEGSDVEIEVEIPDWKAEELQWA